MDRRGKLNALLFGFVFSIAVGLFLASLYAGLQRGLSADAINHFDFLAFWYETPIVKGQVTQVFQRGLMIIAGAAVVISLLLAVFLFRQGNHHGTARWARCSELAAAGYIKRYRQINGPIFGKTTGPAGFGRYLTNGDQPHSLVVAPTRAGKGVGIVIPTLLTFNGSILALDVKGELFELTSRARQCRGDQVFKFAPFDKEGRTHSYNPVLDIVNMPLDRRFSETRRLAHNLIAAKGKGSEGFIDGARDLFVAGILACIERGTPTIGAVYDLFAQPGEKYKLFAQLAEETKSPEAQRIFDNMAGNDTKILTSYTSVLADGGLNLWADPMIKAATTTSDFSVYDLRRNPTSIFLCVSPNDLEVIAPLVRLFFQQVVSILQRTMPGTDEIFEVLFLLDEFKHLGKLESIETAVTTIAGYKGRFMFIIQSLAALKGAYEESGKENFLSNTGVQVFMATADDETPNYISKAIGDYTYRERSTSYSQSKMFDANIQFSHQGAPLLRSEQVRVIDDSTEIVLIKGQPPLRMHKVKYYSDRILKRLFEAQTGPLPEPSHADRISHYPETSAPPPWANAIVTENGEIGEEDGYFQGAPMNIHTARPMSTATPIRKEDRRRNRHLSISKVTAVAMTDGNSPRRVLRPLQMRNPSRWIRP
ncbi:Protein virD4 [Agrobacterium tumefaciens str. Kerr 14]|uniref:Protein virD4 n=1 Tax=Agrobacterium tumefaciens str. Kerr 14 TaxID=1183424 RepID=A0A1S7SAJ3_AGRTU|nr:type IV secretion system ATPase VirD4 [Agrobacterium tumefaciens]CUX65404.1 Protein virD4 [Agrobacterium tumefaciens str. Kerr 14]